MRRYLLILILPTFLLAIYDTKWMELNRLACAINNFGMFGHNGNNPGAYWPKPLRNYYIFGAGIWIGCIQNNDTLVACGYEANSGLSEMVPTLCRYWRSGYTDSLDRIYVYPGDWPPPRSRFPMAPISPRSERDFFCCFSDSDPSRHYPNDRPIGIDVALTVYAFNDSIARDFIFFKYELFNFNPYPINDIYFGIQLDGDVGQYRDDMGGLIRNKLFFIGTDTIRVKNTGFIYDSDGVEQPGQFWQGGTPGAVAISFLASSVQENISSYRLWTIENDPRNDQERYQMMASNTFDSIDEIPGDKRFLIASGPFDLLPESSACFYYALIASPYSPSDTTGLATTAYWAERVFRERLGIEEEVKSPKEDYGLSLYPNPFRSILTINSFSGSAITIDVYNASGQLVKSIKGLSPIHWNARDEGGKILPRGLYFLRIETPKERIRKKVLFRR